jgi:hypothetical protein
MNRIDLIEKLEWHYDAGHAWLKMPIKSLLKCGVAGLISSFSYQDGENVYLEEDCDAPAALRAIYGNIANEVKQQIPEIDDGDNSPIRSMARAM